MKDSSPILRKERLKNGDDGTVRTSAPPVDELGSLRTDTVAQEVTSGSDSSQNVSSQGYNAGTKVSDTSSSDSNDAKESCSSSQDQSVDSDTPSRLPPRKRSSAPKKARSSLRKGKWAVQEEEYTTRIIHYFSTGLLTLPEGATLRSFLADKLNCDPMRITKKYAGASCLGRGVYHFRDQAHPTIAEIQLAKAELDHLEQRFRMRVEEGNSWGKPLPPPNMMIPVPQTSAPQMLSANAASQNAIQAWLMSMATAGTPAAPDPVAVAPVPVSAPAPSTVWPMVPSLNQWLLPSNHVPVAPTAPANPLGVPTSTDPSLQALNDAMASWAYTQAAASLAPALSQLAAANLHQQQQMLQHQEQEQQQSQQRKEQQQPKTTNQATGQDESTRHAQQLKENYERYLKTQAIDPKQLATAKAPSVSGGSHPAFAADRRSQSVNGIAPTIAITGKLTGTKPRTEEDKQAGTILLGFLSSLRQSYEDALVDKQKLGNGSLNQMSKAQKTSFINSESSVDGCTVSYQKRSAQVTESSSGMSQHQVESSVEDSDWNSDKKTDPSSSEESAKEVNTYVSKGPPRKRIKTKKQADDRRAAR